jgi:hypothetical protein
MYFSPEKVGKSPWSKRACLPAPARRKGLLNAGATRVLAAFLAAAIVALVLPALASASYGWPIKPFGQEHPVRGQLNDPRTNGADYYTASSHTFHFGLDVAAPAGTAVYAVAPGRVHYVSSSAVAVRGSKGNFGYWHILPVGKNDRSVKLHTLLGYVAPGRDHVHFAESRSGHYVNPLRRGALTPYTDTTQPTISSLSYYDGSYHDLTDATVAGKLRLTASAFDTPQLVSNWLWAIVTPAKIGWQVFNSNGLSVAAGHWDFGSMLCFLNPLDVFAPGTLKNNSHRPGDYNYWLGPQWDTSKVKNGAYWLVVNVNDVRDNAATKIVNFTVANSKASATRAPAAAK